MLLLHGTCTVLIQEICLHRIGKAGRILLAGRSDIYSYEH